MKATAILLTAAAMLFASAGTAVSAVGWCGNVWPVDGAVYTTDDDISVYVQVWKEGVTDQAGQGAQIGAELLYRCQGDPSYTDVAMAYNGDVGDNDEYTAVIASGHGCDVIDFYCVVTDSTDMETCSGQDQNSNDPPFLITITSVTEQDVTVSFHLCLSGGAETSGDICVTGDHDEITNWGSGVAMAQECPDNSPNMYSVDVLFAAGSNPSVQYKYRKDACETWESVGNRTFDIDDSGPTMDIPIDSWEDQTMDCPTCDTPVEWSSWGTIKALYGR